MRTLTAAAAAEIARTSGAEPVNIVSVDWGGSIGEKHYADRDLTVGSIIATKALLECDLDDISATNGPGALLEVSIILSDADQTLRGYKDSIVMDGRPVVVRQHYAGLLEADLIKLISGEIRGPVDWSEVDHTLAFRAEKTLQDAEITYAPASGDVENLPAEAINKAWPLCFGTVLDVPAFRVQRSPIGSVDETIDWTKTTLTVNGDEFPQSELQTILVSGKTFPRILKGYFESQTFKIESWERVRYEDMIVDARPPADPDYENPRVFWLQDPSQIVVGWLMDFTDDPTVPPAFKMNIATSQQGAKVTCYYNWNNLLSDTGYGRNGGKAVCFQDQGDVTAFNFWRVDAGNQVRLLEQADVYVVNDAPSTEVLRVAAMKGGRLTAVPANLYTVNLADTSIVAGRTVTSVSFAIPLDEADSGWDASTVYVSLRSSLSSNTATAIKWILLNRAGYSEADIDTAAFDAVAAKLVKYPSHFAFLVNTSISALWRIAEEARCQLYSTSGVLTVKYLSEEPSGGSEAATLDDDADIEAEIILSHTSRESSDDFATRLTASWQENYGEEPETITLENADAISAFGRVEATVEFLGYQTRVCVEKTLTWMLARRSRLWKLALVTAHQGALAVEIFDYVSLDSADLWPADTLALVRGTKFDLDRQEITFDLWLPIEEGTSVVSDAAYADDSGDVAPPDPGAGVSAGAEAPIVSDFDFRPSKRGSGNSDGELEDDGIEDEDEAEVEVEIGDGDEPQTVRVAEKIGGVPGQLLYNADNKDIGPEGVATPTGHDEAKKPDVLAFQAGDKWRMGGGVIKGAIKVKIPISDDQKPIYFVPRKITPGSTGKGYLMGTWPTRYSGPEPAPGDTYGTKAGSDRAEPGGTTMIVDAVKTGGSGGVAFMRPFNSPGYLQASDQGGCDAQSPSAIGLNTVAYLYSGGSVQYDKILLLNFPAFQAISGRSNDFGWRLEFRPKSNLSSGHVLLSIPITEIARDQEYDLELRVLLEPFVAATLDYTAYAALGKSDPRRITCNVDVIEPGDLGPKSAQFEVKDYDDAWFAVKLPNWAGDGYGVSLRIGNIDPAMGAAVTTFFATFAENLLAQYAKLLRLPWPSV